MYIALLWSGMSINNGIEEVKVSKHGERYRRTCFPIINIFNGVIDMCNRNYFKERRNIFSDKKIK